MYCNCIFQVSEVNVDGLVTEGEENLVRTSTPKKSATQTSGETVASQSMFSEEDFADIPDTDSSVIVRDFFYHLFLIF